MADNLKRQVNTNAESTLVARSRLANLAGKHFGGDRDLYQVMGYPRRLTPEDFVDIYIRQDIAARVVDAYPDATWREHPQVKEDTTDPAVNESIAVIEKKNHLWRTCHRLDRLTGLGHYGVMVLGLDGGEPMHTPATRTDYNLLYLQPHSERTAQIKKWDDDPSSPRYGMPDMYRVTTGVNWTGSGASQRTVNIHHSRVIHVAERALEDVSIGTPRLERVYNRLMDLDKLLGGSAEIYWQNAAMMIAFIANPDLNWSEGEADAMAEQLEEMQHGLRRMLRLRGVEAQNLSPGLQGSTPGDHVDKQLDMIAGATGIPKRILIGNEAGELASSQDENSWNGRISERRTQYALPAIVQPLIAKGQKLGFIARGNVEFEWDETDSLGEKTRAEIADIRAGALQKYAQAVTLGADLLVPFDEFRTEILGLPPEPEGGFLPVEDDLPEDAE